jgi:hypothetical protein
VVLAYLDAGSGSIVTQVVIGALFWVVIWGALCAVLANSRGRSPVSWGLLGALFGVFAVVFLLASGRGNRNKKRCPECAELVNEDALKCRFCGHSFAPAGLGASA